MFREDTGDSSEIDGILLNKDNLKPQKYYKISSSKYLVKGTIYRGEWDWETDKLENVHKYGSFRLYLKKMPKSHFGYVMQKITLTKA